MSMKEELQSKLAVASAGLSDLRITLVECQGEADSLVVNMIQIAGADTNGTANGTRTANLINDLGQLLDRAQRDMDEVIRSAADI